MKLHFNFNVKLTPRKQQYYKNACGVSQFCKCSALAHTIIYYFALYMLSAGDKFYDSPGILMKIHGSAWCRVISEINNS